MATISELTEASVANDADLLLLDQGGVSKKVPKSVLLAGVGGGPTLLGETIVSTGVSSVDFVGLDVDSYPYLTLEINDMTVATSGSDIGLRFGVSSTFDTTGYLQITTASTEARLVTANNNTSGANLFTACQIGGMASSSAQSSIIETGTAIGISTSRIQGGGALGGYGSNKRHTDLRIFDTGASNITAGTFRVWGHTVRVSG